MKRLCIAVILLAIHHGASRGAAEGPWSWTTHQFNREHTGYVPVTLEPSTFVEMWSLPLSALPLNPVAAADGKVFATPVVYFDEADQLFAVRAATAEVLWTKQFGSVSSVNPPAYGGGRVYVQVGKGIILPPDPLLHVFDGETGAPVYELIFGAQWERYLAPTVTDGVVYANGGEYGGMYAFDAVLPMFHWFIQLNQYDEWTPAVGGDYVYAYTGEYDPRLSIVDRVSGIEVRRIDDPSFVWNGWSMNLAPVLGAHGDVVAVQGGRLISFDVLADAIRFDTGNQNFSDQPSVAHDAIFVIRSGDLSVHDELTGTFLWGWDAGSPLVGTLIVTDSHVIATTESSIHAIDLATHQEAWSMAISGHIAWSEGVLYLARADGVLTAIRAPAAVFRDGFESGDATAWSNTVP